MGRKVRWWRCRLASWMVAARRTLSTKAATILHCTDSWPAQSSCTRTCLHHDSAEHCSGHVLAQASHACFDRSLRHPAGPCDRYLTSIPSLSGHLLHNILCSVAPVRQSTRAALRMSRLSSLLMAGCQNESGMQPQEQASSLALNNLSR